ncbi:MAG TPA: hypothetical protein DIU15_01450, partial [Deltaproteobacteria bacterium]|nr:hypothetical protein [Deltaproteobacteria bacterium]
GEALVLEGGGAAILADDQLHFAAMQGALQGAVEDPQPEPRIAGWSFGSSEVRIVPSQDVAGAGLWRAKRLKVHLSEARRERYLQPPMNPRAQSVSGVLRLLGAQEIDEGRRDRANLVVHRRLALAAGVPLLALLGWFLGWSSQARGRGGGMARPVLLIVLALGLYGMTRICDHLALRGTLSSSLAGWAPWWSVLGMLGLMLLLRGRLER